MLRIAGLTRRYGDAARARRRLARGARAARSSDCSAPTAPARARCCAPRPGLQPPDAGTVRIDGVDLWRAPLEAKRRLGYAAEEPAFYEELSADEYLAFVAGGARARSRRRARARASELARAPRARGPQPTSRSRGSRTACARSCRSSPRCCTVPPVLLCDEALEGFDAAAALAAKAELRALADAGTAVLFSSHVTETIERLCDRVVAAARRPRRARRSSAPPGALRREARSPLERAFLAVARPAVGLRRSSTGVRHEAWCARARLLRACGRGAGPLRSLQPGSPAARTCCSPAPARRRRCARG